MKLLLRLLTLSIIGLLAAACASSTVQVTPTTAPVAPADSQEAAPGQSVSEIRPQFLNSYADW